MADAKIEFRKIRDFGENLNDSFAFIRYNFKPLLGSFFAICGVFMLAFAMYSSMYQSRLFGIYSKLRRGVSDSNDIFMNMFDANYFITIGLGLLCLIAMKVAFNAYVKYQLEHDNRFPAIDDVWLIFRQYFFKVLLYTLLVWSIVALFTAAFAVVMAVTARFSVAAGLLMVMAMFAGIMYCITVFTLFDAVVMLEDAGFGRAFSRCFELMKGNFLSSFVIYCTGYIIYAVCGSLIGVTTGLLTGLVSYFTTEKIDQSVQVATSFLNIFTYTFFILFLVSSTFQYFTLVEKKDGTGILRRINDIGVGRNNFDNIEEQY